MSLNLQWSDLVAIAFAPLQPLLAAPKIVEICINQPGSVYVEASDGARHGQMQHHAAPDLTAERIRFMAERVAAASHQFVNEEEPLLSAALPDGARIQAVLPPAAIAGGALVIRRQVARNLSLADYARSEALKTTLIASHGSQFSEDELALCQMLAQGETEAFLRGAMQRRVSILVSGGTGSGKTTLLNALMREIPDSDRLITIEDTPELAPSQPNHVRLIATRGGQNIARIDTRRLVEASLRMRPDRLLLGEVRGAEALDFLQAINTGHPGSLSTVHANSPRDAYERLAMLVLQHSASGGGLSKADLIDTLKTTVPLIVQVSRQAGRPGVVSEIYYEPFVRARRQGHPMSAERRAASVSLGTDDHEPFPQTDRVIPLARG